MQALKQYIVTNLASIKENKSEVSKLEYNKILTEWLKSINKKTIADLDNKEFAVFQTITENFKKGELPKNILLQLNEKQCSLIKELFAILPFDQAKDKILKTIPIIEDISQISNNIVVSGSSFMPLSFQKVGRDRDSMEAETKRRMRIAHGDNFNDAEFLTIFNSMFESCEGNPIKFYAELNEMLK